MPRCLLVFRIPCQVSTTCSLFLVEPLAQPSLELLKGKPGGKCHLLVPLLLSCLGRILWNKTFLSFPSLVLVMTSCLSLFCFETGSCYVLHWPGLEATEVCAKILLHQPSPCWVRGRSQAACGDSDFHSFPVYSYSQSSPSQSSSSLAVSGLPVCMV